MSRKFKIVCHFQAMGIKEVEATDLDEALKKVVSEDVAFDMDTIRQIGNCQVDMELTQSFIQKQEPEAHKEYLNWGSE